MRHGATTQHVDPQLRTETRQVEATADKLYRPERTDPLMTRTPMLGTKVRSAGFGSPRFGEQNALAGDRRLLRAQLRPRHRLLDHASR